MICDLESRGQGNGLRVPFCNQSTWAIRPPAEHILFTLEQNWTSSNLGSWNVGHCQHQSGGASAFFLENRPVWSQILTFSFIQQSAEEQNNTSKSSEANDFESNGEDQIVRRMLEGNKSSGVQTCHSLSLSRWWREFYLQITRWKIEEQSCRLLEKDLRSACGRKYMASLLLGLLSERMLGAVDNGCPRKEGCQGFMKIQVKKQWANQFFFCLTRQAGRQEDGR